MSRRFQLSAQFKVVIYFTVEHDPDRAIFIADRLMPPSKIDNGEAHAAQTNLLICEDPTVVGSAMADGVQHPVNRHRIRRHLRSEV